MREAALRIEIPNVECRPELGCGFFQLVLILRLGGECHAGEEVIGMFVSELFEAASAWRFSFFTVWVT